MGTIEFTDGAARRPMSRRPTGWCSTSIPTSGSTSRGEEAAQDIHDRLADIGLASFAMLSGGKGVHVVVPLRPGIRGTRTRTSRKRFAEALALAEPERFTANMSKAKRTGRIFLDYLRNQRGSTAVLPYSVRARENAPVAVPIAWSELKAMNDAHPFTIGDARLLIERAEGKRSPDGGSPSRRFPNFNQSRDVNPISIDTT
jgi:bifunctional non-homologous end joining protein LigD